MLCDKVYDQAYKLRQMKGEDLEGLNVEELEQLEKKLKVGLSLVIKTKVSTLNIFHLGFLRTKRVVPHVCFSCFTLLSLPILVFPLFPG
ncbi:hypothetical protein BT93_K0947 [Corymbia citriodora subsp. variegata]|nr:hypothetical protein BT93_K0947 [Corymbia citriodora subsp. variegata]